jgi:hypothetical protein
MLTREVRAKKAGLSLSGSTESLFRQLVVQMSKAFSVIRLTEFASAGLPNTRRNCFPMMAIRRCNQAGQKKRRLLLSYLQEHPEELRPMSRKLDGPSESAERQRLAEK